MKLISRTTHGMLDYLMGGLLIACPRVLGFADNSAATYTPVTIGIAIIFYSLLTDYEAGVLRIMAFRTHLAMDVIAGLLLAASPWIFGFAQKSFWPHCVAGVASLLIVSLTTKEEPVFQTRAA